MRLVEEVTLRRFIRAVLKEEGWQDPQVVAFKREYVAADPNDPDEDEEERDKDAASGSQYKLNKGAEHNLKLNQRGNDSQGNRSMASGKPLAPRQSGGPQSGRQPGGSNLGASISRSYSAGY